MDIAPRRGPGLQPYSDSRNHPKGSLDLHLGIFTKKLPGFRQEKQPLASRERALPPAHGHMRVQETEGLLKTVKSNPLSLVARYLIGPEGPENGTSPTLQLTFGLSAMQSLAELPRQSNLFR